MTTELLRIGQSADPDDAYMIWALAIGEVSIDGFDVEVEFADIETLNRRAAAGRLELTALSAAAYPGVSDRYRLLRCGASFGAEYGPVVVGREPPPAPGAAALSGRRVATPGRHTTARLLLRIFAGPDLETVSLPFDEIMDAVERGEVDAGLVIHEGQLVYRDRGLHLWFEPARQWRRELDLPLPLGVVAVRRDLPGSTQRLVAEAFRAGIEAAGRHREEALAFAARQGRGLDTATLTRFVDQYVDDTTLDLGDDGVEALRRLYVRGVEVGAFDSVPPLDLL